MQAVVTALIANKELVGSGCQALYFLLLATAGALVAAAINSTGLDKLACNDLPAIISSFTQLKGGKHTERSFCKENRCSPSLANGRNPNWLP